MAYTQIQITKTQEAKEKIASYAEDLKNSISKMDKVVTEMQAGEGWDDASKKGADTLIASIQESEAKLAAIQECISNLPIVLQKILDASDEMIVTAGGQS